MNTFNELLLACIDYKKSSEDADKYAEELCTLGNLEELSARYNKMNADRKKLFSIVENMERMINGHSSAPELVER